MNFMRSNNADGQRAGLRMENLCPVFIAPRVLVVLLFVVVGSFQCVDAQAVWFDQGIFSLGYELSTSAPELSPGEQFSIKLYGGVPSPEEAVGLDFFLLLHDQVSVNGEAPVYVPFQSWLGNASDISHGISYSGQYQATVERTDLQAQSGAGWVLSLNCTVGSAGVSSAAVVQNLGGAIIMVDHINPRLAAPPQEPVLEQRPVKAERQENWLGSALPLGKEALASAGAPGIKMFPNPCTEWVRLKVSDGKPRHIQLLNLDGSLVVEANLYPDTPWNIEHLPQGVYLVAIFGENGERESTVRLLKR